MMLKVLFLCISIVYVIADEDFRIVSLEQGDVKGYKYWNGDYYEFYGVPYASVPIGRDRFKGPLPPKKWEGIFEATNNKSVLCIQEYYSGDADDPVIVGTEECLALNLFVPTLAEETNLVPVLVYIHSGGFAIGHGNIARYHYLAKRDVLVISWNYRLGANGFLCLGNEDIPGNAGMKDQVAGLRWINKNIRKFGGNPSKVTVAGYSVGAGMAELLALSKTTKGLIDKIILESGSALSPWAINRNPIDTAKNIAQSIGYNDTGNIKDLAEFYLNANDDILATKSLNFFIKNSTFGFAPCVENVLENIEPFLTESPLEILQKGQHNKVSVVTGFANMEGISRTEYFEQWADEMAEDFTEFLPADLTFKDLKTKEKIIKEIKQFYFHKDFDNLENYIDYFSDSMFTYSILNSANFHAENSDRPVYLYEFSYVGNLRTEHRFMDKVNGVSHREQTSYILDFYRWTDNASDMDTRDRLTLMWTDFAKYSDPTAIESILVPLRWLKYSEENKCYLSINNDLKMKKNLLNDRYNFWKKIYNNYYWHPTPPVTVKFSKSSKKVKDL